jgi:uncharacterized protein (UPF0297 family)
METKALEDRLFLLSNERDGLVKEIEEFYTTIEGKGFKTVEEYGQYLRDNQEALMSKKADLFAQLTKLDADIEIVMGQLGA